MKPLTTVDRSSLRDRLPFTPALSPEEREQLRTVFECSSDVRYADRLTVILPLLVASPARTERAGVRGNGQRRHPNLKN
jgi:hypothetical protein